MLSPLARIRPSTDITQAASSQRILLTGLFAALMLLISVPSALAASFAAGDDAVRELTPALKAAGVTEADLAGPGDPEVDRLHPDGKVKPALGGRLITHVSAEPPNLNFAIENSASIRHAHLDLHAGLLQFSPVTWEYELDTAAGYDVEDALFLKGGPGEDFQNIEFGKIVEETEDTYVIESGSKFHEMERKTVSKADVESVERETVYTFQLRDDVLWQDGHPMDEGDLVFSWGLYKNPGVDCDEKRWKYAKIKRTEVLAPGVVRFFWDEQYFGTLGSFGLDFCILPSHLYNLLDPDHPNHNPEATLEEQAAEINDNPHNIDWVGLGPYRITGWERNQYMDAEKADTYWKKTPQESGYLDNIRWRYIKDDDSAWQAMLNDEIDIFNRLKSEDYVGEATSSQVFTDRAYKALTYVGNIGYTSWNLWRKKFEDVRVRQALGHAFDVQGWIETNYEGKALWSMCTEFYFGPAYARNLEPFEYDIEAAEDLLSEAGWYDRNGNGIVDKDGEELVIQVLMPSGNKASEKFLQALQDAYRKIGVGVDIQSYEWATLLEKILDRDFDAVNMAWTLPTPESDPMQIWHGDEAVFEKRSSNHAGLRDAEVDRLIDAGRRELDAEKRHEIWREMHARIYDLQPYLFGWNVPRKIAINKRVHGMKLYKFEPGYRMRDLYLEAGTPGTRPLDQ
jgi:peptide/nickel transport system substrate-binding protein